MANDVLLAAEGVERCYPARGTLWQRARGAVRALQGVSLHIRAGESVAVVGPSGSGKSTLARVLAGAERPDTGTVAVDGVAVNPGPARALKVLRRTVQLVFQEPALALNPRQRVGAAVAEPLVIRHLPRRERARRTEELLELVGLSRSPELLQRLPRELSGGERQRVALARALACGPRVLILDEPTAAMDASLRGQVVNVLEGLRRRGGVALVVITHDLDLAACACDRVIILDGGSIVEEGATEAVLGKPRHPTSAALAAARRKGWQEWTTDDDCDGVPEEGWAKQS